SPGLTRYHGAWVLPISRPPLGGGWVDVERDRVVGCGDERDAAAAGRGPVPEIDLGHVAILPGVVNAHTHLELSYLRDRIPAADTFVKWVYGIIDARRQRPDPQAAEIVDAVDAAIDEAIASGTAVVGDISNTLVTFDRLAPTDLAALVFYELIRF